MVTVTEVTPRSRAARHGIRVGDVLLSINGHEIRDVLDYRFYLAEEVIVLALRRGEKLIKKKLPIVNLVGGMVNRENISISGNQALTFLDGINIDMAFIVPSGLTLKDGFTSGNYPECELKKMVVEKARKVIVLMDTSKLDRSLPFTFSSIEKVHTIIADKPLPEDITEAAIKAGVEIVVAD